MIAERIAKRLDRLAKEKGIRVCILSTEKPRRRWYSIGSHDGHEWCQVTGSADPHVVECFIRDYSSTK